MYTPGRDGTTYLGFVADGGEAGCAAGLADSPASETGFAAS